MRKCDDVDDYETGEMYNNVSPIHAIIEYSFETYHTGVMSIISIVDISTNRKR